MKTLQLENTLTPEQIHELAFDALIIELKKTNGVEPNTYAHAKTYIFYQQFVKTLEAKCKN